MTIEEALRQLDPTNDDHWTGDGLPRVDVISGIVGRAVTRKEITDAAPLLVRESLQDDPTDDDPGDPDAQLGDAKEVIVAEFDYAHVEPGDDVVGMPPAAVYRDPELIQRALDEFGRQSQALSKRRSEIDAKIRDLGRRCELLSRAVKNLARKGIRAGDSNQQAIQRYLETQNKARAERTARVRQFIAGGVSAKDVADELRGASKLDAAMAQRKPSRGSGRPGYPMAVER